MAEAAVVLGTTRSRIAGVAQRHDITFRGRGGAPIGNRNNPTLGQRKMDTENGATGLDRQNAPQTKEGGFGEVYEEPEAGALPVPLYPFAWSGPHKSSVMSQAELDSLRCATEGCLHTWRSAGGLARSGGDGEWHCVDHRLQFDHSSHRQDLRDAQQRAVDLAVTAERERIISMLEQSPWHEVHNALVAQRPKKVSAPIVAPPPLD